MKTNSITFGITTYIKDNNRLEYLYSCIDSITKQSDPNWELLIYNDNSTVYIDISKFNDNRIKLFKWEANIWMFNWWNFLLNEAKADYFIPMWDDDIVTNDYVKICREILNSNISINAIYTDISEIDECWIVTNSHVTSNLNEWLNLAWYEFLNNRILNSFKNQNTFFCSLINRNKLLSFWWYNNFWNITDVYISYLIAENLNVFYIKSPIIKIRKHSGNASNNFSKLFSEKKILINVALNKFNNISPEAKLYLQNQIKYIDIKILFYKNLYIITLFTKKIKIYKLVSYLWRKFILNNFKN